MVLANIFGLGTGPDGLMVLGVILLLFGGKKLPELARSMGQGVKEFKKGIREANEEDEEDERPKPRSRAAEVETVDDTVQPGSAK